MRFFSFCVAIRPIDPRLPRQVQDQLQALYERAQEFARQKEQEEEYEYEYAIGRLVSTHSTTPWAQAGDVHTGRLEVT